VGEFKQPKVQRRDWRLSYTGIHDLGITALSVRKTASVFADGLDVQNEIVQMFGLEVTAGESKCVYGCVTK